MKLLNIKKKKMALKDIDIILTIDELNDLIKFLNYTKRQFIKRKNDNSINQIKIKDGEVIIEKITSFKKLAKMKNTVIEDHSHYGDWYEAKYHISPQSDIILHTMFQAEKNFDDSFVWINTEK